GVQELLGPGTTHGTGVGLHDDVVEPEAREDALVGVPLRLVGDVESRIGVVEGVRVLHRELASPQQPRARAGLVAILVLDLEDRERKVLVARVEILHEQGEDLFVRGREEIVGALAILQPEDVLAVLLPASGRLVGLARQQRGEQHLLRTCGRHLLADDALDLGAHAQPQRQPGEHSRRLPTDVPGAHEQLVAGGLGVGRVFLQGADEELREERGHPFTVSARAAPRTQLVTTTGSPTGASAPISSAMRCASAMRVATISDSGTVLMTSPFTKICPLPLPDATPRSASRASPGPFTTQPMTATRSGTLIPSSPSVTESASVYTSTCARPHDGHETISSLRSRRLSDCRICSPTLTSSAGGAESETRMVSPIPSESRMPNAVADLMVPWKAGPASVTPRCSGQS